MECLEGLSNIAVVADDILVYGCGESYEDAVKDHDKALIELFQRARQKNLKLNKRKLKFKQDQVTYMGHILTANGLQPDPSKVAAIQEFQVTSKLFSVC